uniref:Odorant binding protein n=1 Tax=Dendrolimus kikuchii TaxID=765133 RepID=A0A076E940_9NEOP|nr:odorant binding protein [Dendrolimus kikuchii]
MLGITVGIIALFVLQAYGFDDEVLELAKMVRESCAGETNVDLSLVEKINAGAELTPDPVLKCYIKCTLETAGMLSDGVMDLEMVMTLLPDSLKNKHGAALEACGTQKGADDCDTAYLTQLCWQKSCKSDFFLI